MESPPATEAPTLPSLAEAISLVVVDDESLFRDLVVSSLNHRGGLEVVGSFANAQDALAGVPPLAPRLALLDLDLGEGDNGIQLGLQLQQLLPELKVVLLSSVATESYLSFLSHAETAHWSCLHKKNLGDLDALVCGLKCAALGLQVSEPSLMRHPRRQGTQEPAGLNARDSDMLRMMAEGASNQALALHFCLSEKTIEGLLAQLYRKLNVNTKDPMLHPRMRASWLHHQSR